MQSIGHCARLVQTTSCTCYLSQQVAPHHLPADVDNSALWLYLLYGLSRDIIVGITLCLSLYIQSPASQSLTVFIE